MEVAFFKTIQNIESFLIICYIVLRFHSEMNSRSIEMRGRHLSHCQLSFQLYTLNKVD